MQTWNAGIMQLAIKAATGGKTMELKRAVISSLGLLSSLSSEDAREITTLLLRQYIQQQLSQHSFRLIKLVENMPFGFTLLQLKRVAYDCGCDLTRCGMVQTRLKTCLKSTGTKTGS